MSILTNAVPTAALADRILKLEAVITVLANRVSTLEKVKASPAEVLTKTKRYVDMTKPELKALAQELGVNVTDAKTKEDFIKALEAKNKK